MRSCLIARQAQCMVDLRRGIFGFLAFLLKKGIASTATPSLASRVEAKNNICAVSSVVEHLPDTEGVTGSNPVSRTILSLIDLDSFILLNPTNFMGYHGVF